MRSIFAVDHKKQRFLRVLTWHGIGATRFVQPVHDIFTT